MKHVIEYDSKCESCEGTGLYIGMGERDGSAVICSKCKGTGCKHTRIEYENFEGRKNRDNVKRVYQTNPGMTIHIKKGEFDLDEFGGISYQDWLDGKTFDIGTEMRNFICPAWWYQWANSNLKPEWKECGGIWGRPFSSCKHFPLKHLCWERFDKENL